MIMVFILLFLFGVGSSFYMGKASIEKRVICEGSGDPIKGAKVNLSGPGGPYSKTTNKHGWANFTSLSYPAAYTILVDIDNDGDWDGLPDVVVFGMDGGTEVVINKFPLALGMQKLG